MYIILLLFVFCAIIAYSVENTKDRKSRNLQIKLCLIVMAIVSGTRLCGGLDFITYEGHYNDLATMPNVFNISNVNTNYELGYTYIASFFKTLGISFYGFCMIEAAFFYFCLWKGIGRYTNHFGLVILVFLYKLFFYNTFISMRQSLTIALFFLMLPLIEQKKYVQYFVCAFFVSRIHNGAYLLFLLYPLIYLNLSKERIVWLNIIFIPMMAIGLIGIDVLGPIGMFLQDNAANEAMASKAGKYFESENLSPIGILHTVEYFMMMFIFYKNVRFFDLNDPKIKLIVWMFLCLLPLFTLLRGSEILTREKDYFTIFYAVILGIIVEKNLRLKEWIFWGTSAMCTLGYYRYIIAFDGGHFLTYTSWLFDSNYSFFLK